MKLLRTAGLLLLSVIFSSVAQYALADTFPSYVRVTQDNSTGIFDGRFNDGTGAAIRFILSDHADSVIVRIKSGQTVVRTLKGVNFSAGDTSVVWNGKTDAGADVANGTFSVQITAYDKGYSNYTEISYPDAAGLSTRGVTAITNPALKNFGMIFAVDNGGFLGAVGATRFTADGKPWGNSKGVPKLNNTGLTLGPSDVRYSPEADNDGYVYVIDHPQKRLVRYHTDTMNVALVDSGFWGGWYINGLSILQNTTGKLIAFSAKNSSSTSGLGTDSRILAIKLAPGATTYFAPKDTLVNPQGQVLFWDVAFGRDSTLYATFNPPTGQLRPGVAKFDLKGKKLPLTWADTSWTVRVDSGRGNTVNYRMGSSADGSKDVLYFVIARLASGNPPQGQGIYGVTNLKASQPTRTFVYPDKQNNASITRSDITTDPVGNIVYFENSNEEIVVISPPTGSNTYTLDSPTSIRVISNAISIAAARIDANNDFVPDRKGDTVTVIGTVNSINFTASANRFNYMIQDETGGITITKGSVTGGGTVYSVGDVVAARGVVGQNYGVTQLDLTDSLHLAVQLLASGNPVTPVTLTIPQYLAQGEKYESMLIKIKGISKLSGAWPAAGQNANSLIFWDGRDTVIFRVDLDTDIDGQPEPTYPIDVVGVATQNIGTAPFNSGYQIQPNRYSDITQNVAAAPNPRFPLLAPANNSTVIINNGAQTVTFQWRVAVDLNGDALIYQWAPVGFAFVGTGNAAKDTFLVRTGNQLVTYLGTKDTVNLRWTVLTKDPANPIVANVDTFTVKLIRGAIVSVQDADILPKTYGLDQNYPNPFNPSTTIRFSLPVASHVTLRVFNMLGQEVVTLLDDVREAGYMQAVWNGRNHSGNVVASGMYVYRIEATSVSGDNRFVSANKMMMLK